MQCREHHPEELKDMKLYFLDDSFTLGTWDDERRQAYSRRVNGDDASLTTLDKVQFLWYRYEKGQSVQNYVQKWAWTTISANSRGAWLTLQAMTPARVLGDRDITSY